MKETKLIIVGGDFGDNPKASSIINKLSGFLTCKCVNGGSLEELKNIDLSPYNLILWMPNVSNDVEKIYPKKPVGSTLICSKLLHEGVTQIDAISRIFKMSGNAVIVINTESKPYSFKLIDALGNSWGETQSLDVLLVWCNDVHNLYSLSERQGTEQVSNINLDYNWFKENIKNTAEIDYFTVLNRKVADKSAAMGGRYFGNCSTRCDLMFPSVRIDKNILVSPRNIDKATLYMHNMVMVNISKDYRVGYNGNSKPSVDTPVQLALYQRFPRINFMIHGHYYIYGAQFTPEYFPCGDLREAPGLMDIIAPTYHKRKWTS